ncbi:hypothetical protein [Asanoa iriomotensis]|uniref:Outer membrane repeat protein n=1 Tax=Asanoa iriomotensis TaxID=234613 RepID=A0ABQ4C074_9ACTN|nr:hypothetical protein [Asanoa iriomotensis]GIF56181.1 hypothetical protein Air01nite_22760 [Asanoa iriomotensis]
MRVRQFLVATIVLGGVLSGQPASAYPGNLVRCNAAALQAAVAKADNAGGGTLNLTPRCTYRLTAPASDDNGLAIVTTPVRINGNRATITRTSDTAFRFFQVEASGSLTLNGLTLRDGRTENGGAIFVNGGRVTLVDSTVTGNTATAIGGGIYSLGTLKVTGSTLRDNTAVQGGGLNNQGVEATFARSTVTGNRAVTGFAEGFGGGILSAGPLTLDNTRVAGNEATGAGASGGGLWNFDSATVTRGSFLGNVASGAEASGGGLWNGGSANVTGTRFLRNAATGTDARGGAVFSITGTTTLTDVKVVANRATETGGGIFREAGTVTPTRTVVTRNRPDNCGNPSTVPGCA